MKYFNLSSEEQEIEKALKKGKITSVKSLAAEKKRIKKAAAYTLAKAKNINIRLPFKTVFKLKARAIAEGIPYQTLASSVLHKYVNQ